MNIRENNEIVRRYAKSLLKEAQSYTDPVKKADTAKMDYIESVMAKGSMSEQMMALWRQIFGADENGPDTERLQSGMSHVDIFENELESSLDEADEDFKDEIKNMLHALRMIEHKSGVIY